MNIFTQGDNNFSEGIETLIVSLCKNNNFENHHFYIMETNITTKNKNKILNLQKKYDVIISFLKPKGTEFKKDLFINAPRYNYEGMLRLLMHEYVPINVDRILYLDADIVVNGNIKDFYYQSFEGKHIVVHSTRRDGGGNYLYDVECGLYNIIKIKLPVNTNVFNNGVFLANLKLWRTDINEQLYIDFLTKNRDDIVLVDQDLMNLVFLEKAKKINNRNYNCTYNHTARLNRKEIKYIKKNVKIIHFVEKIKPWNYSRYLSISIFPFYMKYYKINHPFLYIFRYLIFFFLKPFQVFRIIVRKVIREWNTR